MLAIVIQGILLLFVVYYAAYVLLELRLVALSGRTEKTRQVVLAAEAPPAASAVFPSVSVLLPIYNENEVVEGLIEAAAALDYPAERLEILVLDDSTDATTALARAGVEAQAGRGVNIRLLRREGREGYKAGNLLHGLKTATGEFLAIFDADCRPPRDFLLKTIPRFQEPRLGFLQTALSYSNREASFLTRFQAAEAGHHQQVTVSLCRDGLMASLSGTSCVWRRACMEDVGGLSAATITEDVDLGYRAQLKAWQYAFLPSVVSATELPADMSAFRVQRERWARGLVQNAVRHLRAMLAAPMSLTGRLYAVSLMFSSLLLASFYPLILLALPAALVTESLGPVFYLCCPVFLLAAVAWAWANGAGGGRETRLSRRASLQFFARAYAYVVMFFPMSLYYFCAAARVLAGLKGGFNRTPKGPGAAREKRPPINGFLFGLELLTFAYALATLIYAAQRHNYWVALFSALVCSGFAITLFFSWRERRGA